MAFPSAFGSVVGALAFAVLSSNKQNEEVQKRTAEAVKKLAPYLKRKKILRELKAENADAGAQAEYLVRAAGMPCCGNSRVTTKNNNMEKSRKMQQKSKILHFLLKTC